MFEKVLSQLTRLTPKTKVDSSTFRPTTYRQMASGSLWHLYEATKFLTSCGSCMPRTLGNSDLCPSLFQNIPCVFLFKDVTVHIETVIFQLFKRILSSFTVYAYLEACQEIIS